MRRERGQAVRGVTLGRPGPSRTAEESGSLDDCGRVAEELSGALDVEDEAGAPGSSYTLEVSSPGLDRPLRHADDYRRFAGRWAKIVMREAVDGQTFFKGRLAGVDGQAVLIDGEDGRRHQVPIGVISRANLEVEF